MSNYNQVKIVEEYKSSSISMQNANGDCIWIEVCLRMLLLKFLIALIYAEERQAISVDIVYK